MKRSLVLACAGSGTAVRTHLLLLLPEPVLEAGQAELLPTAHHEVRILYHFGADGALQSFRGRFVKEAQVVTAEG